MTTGQNNPLAELYTQSGPVNIEEIASSLKRFVSIQNNTDKIFLKDYGLNLTAVQKILAYALTKKMLKETGKILKSSISGSEIELEIGLKRGTIDPTFKTLKERGLLLGTNKDYEIPNSSIKEIIDDFKKVK